MNDPRNTGYRIRESSRVEEGETLVDDDDDAVDYDDDDGPPAAGQEHWFSRSNFGTLEWWLHT